MLLPMTKYNRIQTMHTLTAIRHRLLTVSPKTNCKWPGAKGGFTLIELLVVISIIGILAGFAYVSFSYAQEKARISKVKNDLKAIQLDMDQQKISLSKPLIQITGNGCTDCACRTSLDVRTDTACTTAINTSWTAISVKNLPKDPWDNLYMWDENEWEGGSTNCTADYIRSVGKDHQFGTSDDIGEYMRLQMCL